MGLRDRVKKVREALAKAIAPGEVVVVDTLQSFWGEALETERDRKDYMKLYIENPLARQAIDMTVSDAIGGGYFTDVKYDAYSKELVDKFAEKVNLDGLLFLATRDMLVTGDGLLERIYSTEKKTVKRVEYEGKIYEKEVIAPSPNAKLVGLKWIPSYTLKVKMTPVGEILWWEQQVDSKKKYFSPEKIIDFRWNPTGLSAYGTSELESVYDLLKNLDTIRDHFVAIIKRYAKPPIIWKGKGISEEEMRQHKETVENKGPDEDIYLNTDLIEAEVLEIDPRGKFENYYQQLINAAVIGLQTPTLPMMSKTTRAASMAMLDFYEKKIARIRRVIKRGVEREIFKPLVEQDRKAKEVPRLRWNVLSRRFEVTGPELALELFKLNLYTPEQTRKILKKYGVEFPPAEEEEGEGEE